MKRITMSFYINEENDENALNDITDKVIAMGSSLETIKIDESIEKLKISKCENLVVLASPDYFTYMNRSLPSIVSFNKEGYMLNTRKYYTGCVRLFDTDDKESKSYMKNFMKNKNNTGYAIYSVYKIEGLDDSYYIKLKKEIDEEAFISNPYDSFIKLYNKDYFDTLTDENFETVKDLFEKACTSQNNMELLVEFLFYISRDCYYKDKLKFEPKHIESLIKILKDKGIQVASAFKALYSYDLWFKSNYKRTNFDYYVMQYIYGVKPKYIDLIIKCINEEQIFSKYYRSEMRQEIINRNDSDLLLAWLYYLTYCTHNSYWLSKKEAPSDACKVACYCFETLYDYIRIYGIDIPYEELRDELIDTLGRVAISYTSVINHHTGILLTTSHYINTTYTNKNKEYVYDKKLTMEVILIALERLTGRSRNTIRESILAHIINADTEEKGYAKDMNEIVKNEKLKQVQNSIMKVKLKKN